MKRYMIKKYYNAYENSACESYDSFVQAFRHFNAQSVNRYYNDPIRVELIDNLLGHTLAEKPKRLRYAVTMFTKRGKMTYRFPFDTIERAEKHMANLIEKFPDNIVAVTDLEERQ